MLMTSVMKKMKLFVTSYINKSTCNLFGELLMTSCMNKSTCNLFGEILMTSCINKALATFLVNYQHSTQP